MFSDVPPSHWAYDEINALFGAGYVAGCSADPLKFCPGRGHTRAEGTVSYLRMLHGPNYVRPEPST